MKARSNFTRSEVFSRPAATLPAPEQGCEGSSPSSASVGSPRVALPACRLFVRRFPALIYSQPPLPLPKLKSGGFRFCWEAQGRSSGSETRRVGESAGSCDECCCCCCWRASALLPSIIPTEEDTNTHAREKFREPRGEERLAVSVVAHCCCCCCRRKVKNERRGGVGGKPEGEEGKRNFFSLPHFEIQLGVC